MTDGREVLVDVDLDEADRQHPSGMDAMGDRFDRDQVRARRLLVGEVAAVVVLEVPDERHRADDDHGPGQHGDQ